MRKALIVCSLAASTAMVASLGGCGTGEIGSGGAGGSPSGPAGPSGTSKGSATVGTGNASSGNASTSAVTGTSAVGTTAVTTGGGNMEPANMTGMTAAHNAARAAVNPAANPSIPPLAWSSTVASFAQTYSQNCVFAHSNGPYGENIYATSGSATPQSVVGSWVSEAGNYNYANNSCSGVCGHYTQVVWRDTASLGCGVTNCSVNSPFGSGNWQFWVCDYDPPGNFNNMKPY